MESSKSSKVGFLDLPLVVRIRIYLFAGLVRKCSISIGGESHRWAQLSDAFQQDRSPEFRKKHRASKSHLISMHSKWPNLEVQCARDKKLEAVKYGEDWYGCVHPSLPRTLLRLSKRINQEVLHLLWERNSFLVRSSFRNVFYLRLDLLISLEIQLTNCPCRPDHECPDIGLFEDFNKCKECHFGCKRGSGKPLTLEKEEDKAILQRWEIFAAELRSKWYRRVRFTLICDCMNLEVALRVVSPLERFPQIETATVRLGQSCQQDMNQLAKNTVAALTGSKEPTFDFARLPNELQQLVLEQTDLVAPDYLSWHEPLWGTDDGQPGVGKTIHNHYYAGLTLQGNKQHYCCFECTQSGEVCACPSRHAAYSSRVCKCWQFPSSHFLVSKGFRQQAIKTFFSRNKFVLWGSELYQEQGEFILRNQRFDKVLKVLREMPSEWASNVCWLRIRSTHLVADEGIQTSDSYITWVAIANLIKKRFKHPTMTFELDLADNGYLYSSWRWKAKREDEETIIKSLWGITDLFKTDGKPHYKDFFAFAGHSVKSLEDDHRRWNLERELESYIMGEGYNAIARGKFHDKSRINESLRPKRWWNDVHGDFGYDPELYVP